MPSVIIQNDEDRTGLNLTSVMFMCNSNKQIKYRNRFIEEFDRPIRRVVYDDLFGDEEQVDEVFGADPPVKEVVVQSFGAETGSKKHRAHFNLSVDIWHQAPKYSLSKLRARMANFLNIHAPLPNGSWTVYAKLAKRWDVNYANKEERWENNDSTEPTEELDRVSSEEPLFSVVDELGNSLRAMNFDENPRLNKLQGTLTITEI